MVPSTSRTAGSPAETVASKTTCSAWKSSRRPDGAVPSKWVDADVQHLTRRAVEPGLLADLADQRVAARSSPWSMPPPGRVHQPGCGPRAELRVSSTSGPAAPSRTTRAYAATRCSWNGPVLGEHLGHQADHRHRAVEHAGHRLPGRLHRRAVDLDDVRLRAVHRHPAVVDDPQRVGVRAPALPPGVALVVGVDVRGLADDHVQPGLLVHLADHRVARVLAVLEAPARERPQLLAGQPLGQPAEQDVVVAQDDGVRRHPLHLPHLPVRSATRPTLGCPGPQSGAMAARGMPSSANDAGPLDAVAAEVGGVPRRVLPRPRPVLGQLLERLEPVVQPAAQRAGGLREVGVRRRRRMGCAEADVDQSAPGELAASGTARPAPASAARAAGRPRRRPAPAGRRSRGRGRPRRASARGRRTPRRSRPRGRRRRSRPRRAAAGPGGTPPRAPPGRPGCAASGPSPADRPPGRVPDLVAAHEPDQSPLPPFCAAAPPGRRRSRGTRRGCSPAPPVRWPARAPAPATGRSAGAPAAAPGRRR